VGYTIIMNNFSIYFKIGFDHIANLGALDHLLFMAALTLRYQFNDWKKLLILITAFTIGHTITLALCVLNMLNFNSKVVEFLIPVTIAITAFSNLFERSFNYKSKFPIIYWFALFFGLIHGLGFSNNLKMIIGNSNLAIKLFAANLGIETTQIIFVFVLLLIQLICTHLIKINKREYLLFISGTILGVALYMAVLRNPF
jgi:HupE / UreJ protein